jgi:hypothetical protein
MMYGHIRVFISITFMMALLLVLGCASNAAKDNCPSIDEEPISACRAQSKCKQHKTSYGFGLGVGVGSNLGLKVGQTQTTDNYTSCIDENLKAQKAQQQVIETKSQ